jgi:UMF1 family MFS transporter
MSGISGLLRRIGLGDRKHWSWALYDFGNSGFATTIMAVLLPIYFFDVAAKHLPENIRTAYWGYGAGISLLFVALMSSPSQFWAVYRVRHCGLWVKVIGLWL